MGVYIKGMKIPTNCFECGFSHHSVDDGYYDFEYCGANNAEFNNAYDSTKPHINPFEEKLKTCPLVPVPPHGRLIDADAFTKDECNNCDGACEALPCDCLNCKADCRCDFMKDIADAPTIIPAEEGE